MKQFNFNTLSKTPNKFYRYTGLSVGEFFDLREKIEPLWQESERKRLSHPNRQRAIGRGKPLGFSRISKGLLFFYSLWYFDFRDLAIYLESG